MQHNFALCAMLSLPKQTEFYGIKFNQVSQSVKAEGNCSHSVLYSGDDGRKYRLTIEPLPTDDELVDARKPSRKR